MKKYILISFMVVAISFPVAASQALANCLRLTKELVAQGPQKGGGNNNNNVTPGSTPPPVLAPLPLTITPVMSYVCTPSGQTITIPGRVWGWLGRSTTSQVPNSPVQGEFKPHKVNQKNILGNFDEISQPLTAINFGISDANDVCTLTGSIGSNVLSDPRIAELLKQVPSKGSEQLCIGVNLLSNNNVNQVQFVLIGTSGIIYAQCSYTLGEGVGALDHFYVEFNAASGTLLSSHNVPLHKVVPCPYLPA